MDDLTEQLVVLLGSLPLGNRQAAELIRQMIEAAVAAAAEVHDPA